MVFANHLQKSQIFFDILLHKSIAQFILLCMFVISNQNKKNKIMKTQKIETKSTKKVIRELMIDLYEVGETMTSFGYALKMCVALRNNEITLEQFDMLSGDLYLHCQKNKIATSNQFCSLF